MKKRWGKRITVATIAVETNVCPNTVRKWTDEGRIKNVKKDVNGWRIYTKEAIEEILILAGLK